MKKIIRLTESDLHRIVKESVNRIIKEGRIRRGYVPNDGNSMVGGHYESNTFNASKDVLNDLLENIQISPEEYDSFEKYCEENPDVFVINGKVSSSYDESTRYGNRMFPVMEIESIDNEQDAINYVAQYPNRKVAQIAVKTLNDIIDGLKGEDFNFDDNEYEPDLDSRDY
jgi:hypothetical protein